MLVKYKVSEVAKDFKKDIKDITDNGWLVHSFRGDVPTRANEKWGKEMLEAVADYIADFSAQFEKAPLPANKG